MSRSPVSMMESFINKAEAQTIELPVDFVPDLTASANAQIGSFSPVLILVMGLGLALLAMSALVIMLKR